MSEKSGCKREKKSKLRQGQRRAKKYELLRNNNDIVVMFSEMNILQEFASFAMLQTNLNADVPLLGHQGNLFQQILKPLLSSV